jgi:nucleoside-diphosphate-sugar epimerase
MRNRRIAVIGADSFTGRYLVPELERNGAWVFGTSRSPSENLYFVDLLDQISIEKFLLSTLPTHVVFLAGYSRSNANVGEKYFYNNIFSVHNFISAVRKVGLVFQKIVYASTSHVYGNVSDGSINEFSAIKLDSFYSLSKFAAEEALRREFCDELIIARPFNYSGVGQSLEFLLPKLVSSFAKKDDKIILGNLYPIRDFNDVRNVCKMYSKIVALDDYAGVVNICSGVGHSISELLEFLANISNHNVQVEIDQSLCRVGEPSVQIGSTAVLSDLGVYCNDIDTSKMLEDMYYDCIKRVVL